MPASSSLCVRGGGREGPALSVQAESRKYIHTEGGKTEQGEVIQGHRRVATRRRAGREAARARFEEGWAAAGGRGAPRSLPLSGYFWFSPRARSPSACPSSQLHTCSRGCNWIGWCCVVRMLPLAVPANGKRRKVVQRYDVRIWRGTWGPREAETQSDGFFNEREEGKGPDIRNLKWTSLMEAPNEGREGIPVVRDAGVKVTCRPGRKQRKRSCPARASRAGGRTDGRRAGADGNEEAPPPLPLLKSSSFIAVLGQ